MNPQAACPLVRGRFAPSPTGRMHAGNVFAALMAWLLARRYGGKMVLRIEDLDSGRSRPEHADALMRDLEMLGLSWDEGPFYQSERVQAYREAFNDLRQQGRVYPCFCTRADVAAASAPHAGDTQVYAGTCRNLDAQTRAQRTAELERAGRKPSWRLAVDPVAIAFGDVFQGPYCVQVEQACGDVVLCRANGDFAYQLAVVLDDAEQGVTQVTRGCDLLDSTGVQMYLQRCLELSHPSYAHVPLIVNKADGRRLSKRDGDAGMDALLQRFGSPRGVLGHMAWISGIIDQDEPCAANDLLRFSDLDALKGRRFIEWS